MLSFCFDESANQRLKMNNNNNNMDKNLQIKEREAAKKNIKISKFKL